jgi:hypothetical protein
MVKILLASIFIITVCTLFNNVNSAINLFYPSSFTDANCSANQSWTIWFNIGKPNGSITGDKEDTALILSQNPKTMCIAPTGIHAQSINYRNGIWIYGWRWAQTTDIVAFVSFYSTKPANVDFQVRYCCLTETIIGPITITTTPMPLDNLTCGQQEITPRSHITSRIFGGTNVIANSWPWVSLLMSYKSS